MSLPVVVAVTGASGAVYAVRLLSILVRRLPGVHLTISESGKAVLASELGVEVDLAAFEPRVLFQVNGCRSEGHPLAAIRQDLEEASELANSRIRSYYHKDFMAPMASGSFLTGGMVICPCSGGTLSAVAHAASTNLIHRAADVHLKEGRPLILVPRETPLSTIQLENMKRCADAGAVVLPAMPGFYHGATTFLDLVDFVVARICDQLGIEHSLIRRWGD
jgi:4-hydroxy-3-polyprenylbenzoate decarboxylase